MAAYLVDHPPARSQYRKGRRATPTGTIVLHTAENTADLVGNDAGAENIARFIAGRSDPGSYHIIGDRDSQILLVPLEWEAFHDGTDSNPWSIGISLAIEAAWFRQASNEQKLWYMARLATMARTASDWLTAAHDITVPARRLTKTSQREAGFCTHMDRETWQGTPGRRSDPWGNSDEMWHLFLTLYDDTAHQEDDMANVTDDQLKVLVAAAEKTLGAHDGALQIIRADAHTNGPTHARILAELAALRDAVEQLSGGSTVIDYAKVQKAAEAALKKAAKAAADGLD